ncbi:hypothetical protein [Neobacillus drentensis]|uniref:hypothetical protein n=1 Tax=Neobacillus drentensis TaxID=220684 RepID=UPI002FFEF4EA
MKKLWMVIPLRNYETAYKSLLERLKTEIKWAKNDEFLIQSSDTEVDKHLKYLRKAIRLEELEKILEVAQGIEDYHVGKSNVKK